MRAVVQRVREARVLVGPEVVGEMGAGLLALVGVALGDEAQDALYDVRNGHDRAPSTECPRRFR